MARYTVHETYEYYVYTSDAATPEEVQEIFEAYQSGEEDLEVTFTQNYTHIYDIEGKEV